MENQVLNFDIDLAGGGGSGSASGGGGGISDDAIEIDNDDEDMLEASPSITIAATSSSAFYGGELDLEPYEGMEFESEEAAKAFYNSYARRIGFSTRVSSSRRSRRDGAIIQRSFVCAKEGFRNLNEKRTKDREIKRPRMITRVGCKAMLSVKIQECGKWVVSGFVKEHNHELVPPDQVHCLRSHRQISGPAKTLIDTLQAAGLGPRRIMSALIKEYGGISKVGFTEVDCRNYMRNNRQRSMEGDIQLLIDYLKQMSLESEDFYYAVQGDDDHSTGNVFWADGRARINYSYFGDTVTFDTTYRSNRYRLPFAPFTGVNHHGQPVLFGCAFLINESEGSFVWLFNTWLEAMSGKPPVSITTDHDVTIMSAITQVFPDARHRFCKWHIFKKCQEKLSHLLLQHPAFEADFHKCVNVPETVDEFESCWLSLLDRYDLRDNEWLQSIYSARKQWVPVYLRDAFFAEMSNTQRSDSMNSYFDGYVNASTNLNQFFKLYEKALDSRNEKEVKADYETMSTPPVLKTPSPMEKQASELYTRKIFSTFQDELVGTLTLMATKAEDDGEVIAYQVAKYGEDHKAFFVRFNVLEMKATCSCQMFEFSGVLCRHVLAVFRVTNVLTLPSHYILKRWTRNAKSNVMLDDQCGTAVASYLESHTVRYNTLRHEAFKFVDEGASSSETYDVAMEALQEAAKKVAHASKNNGRSTLTNGRIRNSIRDGRSVNKDQRDGDLSSSEPFSEDHMDQKIRELSKELECANRKCEVYRANLFSVLKDIEDHKQLLAVKVHNVKLSLKDSIYKGAHIDKAIDMLDEAGARVSLQIIGDSEQKGLVTKQHIEELISPMNLGLKPVRRVSLKKSKGLSNMEEAIRKHIIGQHEAVEAVSRALLRAQVGIRDRGRPIASFLFTGPIGVGKTELANAVAIEYFGSVDSMKRLDMSEYKEGHSISKLMGSPPGYVGYDKGGQLTNAIKGNPKSVVLFDEIEKAHEDIYDSLLQLLEDGRLTDGRGNTVDFTNTVIILTSNIGHRLFSEANNDTGSGGVEDYHQLKCKVMEELKKVFRLEIINRLDDVLVFQKLSKDEMRKILEIMLSEFNERLKCKNLVVEIRDSVKNKLIEEGYDPTFGARPLRRCITALVEDSLAQWIVDGDVKEGDSVVIDLNAHGDVIKDTPKPEDDC